MPVAWKKVFPANVSESVWVTVQKHQMKSTGWLIQIMHAMSMNQQLRNVATKKKENNISFGFESIK